MQSQADTVDEYIESLPEDRRAAISKLRALLRRRVPKGYRESMIWGAITWSVPLEKLPDTYNGQPLCYVALASQKNYNSLYLMSAYGDPSEKRKLEAGFRKAGKKLDMGKSCVRFRTLDDLPLDLIGDIVAGVTPETYIAAYTKARGATAKKKKASASRKAAR